MVSNNQYFFEDKVFVPISLIKNFTNEECSRYCCRCRNKKIDYAKISITDNEDNKFYIINTSGFCKECIKVSPKAKKSIILNDWEDVEIISKRNIRKGKLVKK